jgi:plastocyanin
MLRRPWWVLLALAIIPATTWFALPASAGGGGACHQRDMTTSVRNDVVMKDFCFKSTITRVHAGEPVTFTNKDPYAHNVVGWRGDWGRFRNMQQGDTFAYTFNEPGVYPFACYLHYGMTGAVVVDEELQAGSAASVVPGSGDGAEEIARGDARLEDEGRAAVAGEGTSDLGTLWMGALATIAVVAAGLALRSRRRSPTTPESPAT